MLKSPLLGDSRILRNLVLLCCTILFVFTISLAYSMPSKTTLNLMDGNFEATSRADRLAIADDLLRTINSLDDFVPNPTPEQTAWVNSEEREIDNIKDIERKAYENRINNLYESTEFQEAKLKNYLKLIKNTLSCVKSSSDLKKEIYCWCYLSYLLGDQPILNDAILILKRNKKIPNDIEDKAASLEGPRYDSFYHEYSEGILKYIVLPYLSSGK